MPFSRRASGTTRGAGTDSPPGASPPGPGRGTSSPEDLAARPLRLRRREASRGRGAGAPTSAGKTSAAPCSPVRRRWARTRRH